MTEQERIISEEGLRLTPYKDTLGNWTCGVGHLLKSDCGSISLKLAGEWLEEDLEIAHQECLKCIPFYSELCKDRQYVLKSMMFNMGRKKLLGFRRFLLALDNRAYSVASEEMLNSLWAKQVKGRAIKLARCMRTGKWSEK